MSVKPIVKSPSLIIIPTLNEIKALPLILKRIEKLLPDINILIVDDDSQDGTPEFVRSHTLYEKQVFLLARKGQRGLGSAYVAGFEWALSRPYQQIVQMDADLSHNPSCIPKFLKLIEQGADLVVGSRYLDGVRVLNWPISRLLLSLFASYYVRWFTGIPVTDPTGGFKCFRSDLLKKIDIHHLRANGYAFQIETTFSAWILKAKIAESPIIFEDRKHGETKMNLSIAWEAVWLVLLLAVKRILKRH